MPKASRKTGFRAPKQRKAGSRGSLVSSKSRQHTALVIHKGQDTKLSGSLARLTQDIKNIKRQLAGTIRTEKQFQRLEKEVKTGLSNAADVIHNRLTHFEENMSKSEKKLLEYGGAIARFKR